MCNFFFLKTSFSAHGRPQRQRVADLQTTKGCVGKLGMDLLHKEERINETKTSNSGLEKNRMGMNHACGSDGQSMR